MQTQTPIKSSPFTNEQQPIQVTRLIEEARKLRGVTWQHQGRSQWGVDCIGFVTLATSQAGLDLPKLLGIPDRRDYSRKADPELYALVGQYCERIAKPIAGCLIVMQFPYDKNPRHFGLYTAEGNMIHADAKAKRVVEVGFRAPWSRLQHSLWKIPGVEYEAAP